MSRTLLLIGVVGESAVHPATDRFGSAQKRHDLLPVAGLLRVSGFFGGPVASENGDENRRGAACVSPVLGDYLKYLKYPNYRLTGPAFPVVGVRLRYRGVPATEPAQ